MLLTNCVQISRDPQSVKSRPHMPASIDAVTIVNEKATFQTCNSENKNYFQKNLLSLHPTFTKRNEQDWKRKIPIQCIQVAMEQFSGSYATCADGKLESKGVRRPCLSEEYVNFVYNAYHDVKDCFSLDPKRSFLQIFVESGFHINAYNRSGKDAGIGQFTKAGIDRVGHSLVNRVYQVISESSNPSCERIASLMGSLAPDSSAVKNRCSVLTIPENPYRSLVMHYLHTLKDQQVLKDEIQKIDPEFVDLIDIEIAGQLSFLPYNRGIDLTMDLLKEYFELRKKAGQTVTRDDLNLMQNLSDARRIMKEEPRKRQILEKAMDEGLLKKMSFAEFLVIKKQDYMSMISEARDYMNTRIGEGWCF